MPEKKRNHVNVNPKLLERNPAIFPLPLTALLKLSTHSAAVASWVDQLRQFPLGKHDDGPDALEMAVQVARYKVGRVYIPDF